MKVLIYGGIVRREFSFPAPFPQGIEGLYFFNDDRIAGNFKLYDRAGSYSQFQPYRFRESDLPAICNLAFHIFIIRILISKVKSKEH